EPGQFEEKIDLLEEQLRSRGQEKDQIHNDLKRVELEEQEARRECHELELLSAKQTGEKEHYQHKIQELTEEMWELSQEESILEQDLSAWEQEISTSDPLLQKIEEDISAGNMQLQQLDLLVASNEAQKQKCLMELAEIRVISKEVQERNTRLMEHHNELLALISETSSTITRREEEIKHIQEKIDELKIRKIKVDEDQGPLVLEKEQYQDKKVAMTVVIEQMREQLSLLKDKSIAIQSALEDLNSMIQDLEIRKNELSLKHDTLVQRYKERYEIDIVPLPYEEQERDWDQDLMRIKELDEKIRNMGEVNVLAIGEYDALKERHQFLEEQHNDLIRAKEGIVKAIQKINKTSKEMFLETFIQVRESFREIYRMLFGGGRADISLSDDQSILECGIDVVAQPPGKKLQNISLLSGGEKTLTALALLLSIFKVRPSPFCFMDEMDAALDESNIGRFLNLLSEFKKNTQFVVITHSKKTISLADAIYGVTMEESGVSKVYSMKMPARETVEQEALPA
ncbi:MAG: AAA family ATPase, partial [Chlamydiota bacterium]|nr:AAA family ATPase [Chlamydiota bacterium]